MSIVRTLGRLARPLYMLLAALTYMLGAGIARYLGREVSPSMLLAGLLAAVLNPLGMMLLAAAFRPLADPITEGETRQERQLVRNGALYIAMAALAATGFMGIRLMQSDLSSPGLALILMIALAVTISFGVPPFRLAGRGFGELLIAVQLAYVAPSLGFLLLAGKHHALLYACVAALTLLLVATLIVLELPSFAQDAKFGRGTLTTRMGWENALRVHHALVVGAYVLLAAAGLSGFSFALLAPAFITIPFAALEIYLLRGIAGGAKPIWGLLTANAIALFVLTAYLLAFSFWSR